MISISLCMIVKNEEQHLSNCLNSVKDLVDEIIIVDTGSQDQTKEIAAGFSAKIYDFPWINDFSAARNFSFSKATKDYILWLDADDIIKPEDQEAFKKAKEKMDGTEDAIYMKYNTSFDSDGKPTFSYYRERLVKRTNQYQWSEPVHECLHVAGRNIKHWDIAVSHHKLVKSYSSRNLDIYEMQIKNNKPLSPRGQYYYARELKYHNRNEESIKYFEEFLDTKGGWKEDCINACLDLSYLYAKIGDNIKAKQILYKSFEYDIPRGEICCRLGELFRKENAIKAAIFWYVTASHLEIPKSLGFIQSDYYGIIPCIWLTALYDQAGDREKALLYHNKAKAMKPNHPSVIHNEEYFNRTKQSV